MATRTRPTMPSADELATSQRDLPAGVVPGDDLVWLEADQLVRHPDNIRFEVTLDEETLESIRAQGVLQPVLVGPTPGADTYTILDGNRRHLHVEELARQDVHVRIPAYVREDLVTTSQQREVMLITALHRLGISAAEESVAYEQLTLDGLDVATIAKRTGRNPATVKSRLKLGTLSDKARGSLHTGQITIGDAEALATFADDHEAYARLESEIGSPYFASQLRQEQNRRQLEKETAKEVKAAKKAGLVEVDASDGWNSTDGPCPIGWTGQSDQEIHASAGCLAFGVSYGHFSLVCTAPASHRTSTTPDAQTPQEKSEWEKGQAERDARRAEALAAMQLRAEHAARVIGRTITVGSLGSDVVELLRFSLPTMLLDGYWPGDAFRHLAGLGEATVDAWLDEHWPVDVFAAVVVKTFVAFLVDQADGVLLGSAFDDSTTRRVVAWDWVRSTGHDLSPTDEDLEREARSAAAEADEQRAGS